MSFYRPTVEEAFGADVDFSQLVKDYGRDDNPETERRYSLVTVSSTAHRVMGRGRTPPTCRRRTWRGTT